VWIGDDAAVLAPRPGLLLVTTDLSVAGVHGDLALIGLDDLGWRALAAAVSDVAAMGGRPDGAVVAVAGPSTTDLDLLYEGIAASAEVHRCPVVGGDLSNSTELVLAVTVTGHVDVDPGPVLRSGARPGDELFVTGPLGAAAAGLRLLRSRNAAPGSASAVATGDDAHEVMAHRRPRALLIEGEVARLAGASAMIDVSDGLVADLGHIAEASGVGFHLGEVPVSPGATLEEALGGGEDYELVIAMTHGAELTASFARSGLRPPILIGTCSADPTERTLAGEPVTGLGWEHEWR
jgi:thiamine-monophosphate kinase